MKTNELVYTGRAVSALYAILKSLNTSVKKILLPVNICEIVYPVIEEAGFIPVFHDVNKITGNADLIDIQNKYSNSETVLLVVHNFGRPVEIELISNWAKKNKVFLIEDVCNSLGATYRGKDIGQWGDAAIFSFGYSKIISNGVGGAALIKDETIKNNFIKIVNSMKFYNEELKEKNEYFQSKIRNIRLSKSLIPLEIYPVLYKEYSKYLIYKLNSNEITKIKEQFLLLKSNLKRRKIIANRYRTEIKNSKVRHIDEVSGQVYWRYNILFNEDERDNLISKLLNNNILVSKWYPPICNFFVKKDKQVNCPGSTEFSKRVINLFVDDSVSDEDASKTINIINKF